MLKPKVFVTQQLLEPGISILQQHCDVEFWPEPMSPAKSVLLDKVTGIDGLVSFLTDPIDDEVIAACDHVRVISQVAVGYDNIDIDAATAKGIIVTHTPGILTDTTADYTFALLLATTRRIAEADRYIRHGNWEQPWSLNMMLGHDIHHQTLGIIGLGRIGEGVARRAKGFSMRILYHDIKPRLNLEQELGLERVSLDRLLREADFVTIHTPLTSDTRGMIGYTELKKMKSTASLINTARGAIIDQPALIRALKEHVIAYAGLDVFEDEPIPANHPLLELDNVTLTPHIASASITTRSKMAQMAVDNCIAVLQNKMPHHPVNHDLAKQLLSNQQE